MHRKLSGNKYWGVVVGEFAGGDFFCFSCFVINKSDYTHI